MIAGSHRRYNVRFYITAEHVARREIAGNISDGPIEESSRRDQGSSPSIVQHFRLTIHFSLGVIFIAHITAYRE